MQGYAFFWKSQRIGWPLGSKQGDSFLKSTSKIQIIADQFKGDLENGDNWQLLCDSHKVFRPRLLATGMIRSTDFIDNMGYDYEWQAELKYLYDQKEIAVF